MTIAGPDRAPDSGTITGRLSSTHRSAIEARFRPGGPPVGGTTIGRLMLKVVGTL
jgi:hypothetical protein